MKKVLLYSGGMDSLICSALLQPDVCLYVNTGSQYAEKELEFIQTPVCGELTIDYSVDLKIWERSNDLIVPMRNAFLCLVAAYYGDQIFLGATYGDRSTDKDQVFAEGMTFVLKHMWQPQHWCPEGRKPEVVLPFKDMTKAKMVSLYLSRGLDPLLLTHAVSCYHSEIEHCGACKPCARKWVALELNKIQQPLYQKFPGDYFTPQMIEKMWMGKYRGPAEDNDILLALKEHRLV